MNAPPADADLRSEVEQLKQLVREQQKRIEALETEHQNPAPSNSAGLSATRPAGGEASDSAAGATNLPTTSDQSNQHACSSDERIRNLVTQTKSLGPTSCPRDVRLRAQTLV